MTAGKDRQPQKQMLNRKKKMIEPEDIYKIQNMVIEEVEKLKPEIRKKYHISAWLIRTVIKKYYKWRYEHVSTTTTMI